MQTHRTYELEGALENIPEQASQTRAHLSPGNRVVSRQKRGWGVARAGCPASEHIFKSGAFLR